MADQKLDISIKTTGDASGAKVVVDAITKVEAATEKTAEKTEAQSKRAIAQAEAQARKLELIEAKKSAAIEIATQKSIAAQEREAKKAEEVAKRKQKAEDDAAEKSTKNRGLRQAGQVGLQAQDVVVGAQMGQQASTILLQQGSQLLGAFGPQGAIAGALLAFGVVIYKGITKPLEEAREEMKKSEAALQAYIGKLEDAAKKAEKAFNTIQGKNRERQATAESAEEISNEIKDLEERTKKATDENELFSVGQAARFRAKDLRSRGEGLLPNAGDREEVEAANAAGRARLPTLAGNIPAFEAQQAENARFQKMLDDDLSARGRTGAQNLKELNATIESLGKIAADAKVKIDQVNTSGNLRGAMDAPAQAPAVAPGSGFAGQAGGGGFAGQDQQVVAKAEQAKAKDDALAQISEILKDGKVDPGEAAGLVAAVRLLTQAVQTGSESQKQAASSLANAVKALADNQGNLKQEIAEALAAVSRVASITNS